MTAFEIYYFVGAIFCAYSFVYFTRVEEDVDVASLFGMICISLVPIVREITWLIFAVRHLDNTRSMEKVIFKKREKK